MELKGLKRGLQFLTTQGQQVARIITDRHVQVKKLLRETHPGVIHNFDVWNVAKGENYNSIGYQYSYQYWLTILACHCRCEEKIICCLETE